MDTLVDLIKWFTEIFLSVSIKTSIAVYIVLNIYAYMMTERPLFFYNKKVAAFNKLFEETKLGRITYRPYFMSPSPFFQFLSYLTTELFVQTFRKPNFVREEFELQDGGLMALDWTIDDDGTAFPQLDKDGRPTKPILIVIPGLSGSNDNLYTLSVLNKGRKQGYKCCTLVLRGCAGLPLKTAMLSNPAMP